MGRVLAIASGGGHWIELRRLMPAFDGMDVAYASIYPDYAQDVPDNKFYSFCDFNRFNKMNIFKLLFQISYILIKERPTAVITTGSAPALLALALAKTFLRSKTIWIDSIANCEKLSTSGSIARYVADEWLTQWAHLVTPGGPSYWGDVL